MIVRTWRAAVATSREAFYYEKVREIVLPGLRKVPGFIGAHFLRRPLDVGVEILVLSYWESMASIDALTSGDPPRAYLPPAMVAILDEFDDVALHYEVKVSDFPEK